MKLGDSRVTRGYFLRGMGLMTVAASSGTLLAACGGGGGAAADGDTLSRLREQGFVKVAIGNEPPYAYIKDGKVTGAAVEVPRAVLKELGIPRMEGTITEYGSMIPGLQAKRFDMITAGLFMNRERCGQILYSGPDVCSTEAFAVKEGNPLNLNSYKDVAKNPDAKVGVPGGGIEEGYARDAGVPNDRIVVIPDPTSGTEALEADRIDAYGLPTLSIKDLVEKNPDNIEMVSPLTDVEPSCAGAGFRKEDEKFRDAYNKKLSELKESGEFAKIVKRFGFPVEPALEHTTEELCKA